jgi:hypothetical protein
MFSNNVHENVFCIDLVEIKNLHVHSGEIF